MTQQQRLEGEEEATYLMRVNEELRRQLAEKDSEIAALRER